MKTYLEGACDAGTTVIVGENISEGRGAYTQLVTCGEREREGETQRERETTVLIRGRRVTFPCALKLFQVLFRTFPFRDEEKTVLDMPFSLC